MAKIKNIAQFRQGLGTQADGYSDEELAGVLADAAGIPIDRAFTQFGLDTAKGPWSERAGASIDRYQANLYGVAEAVTERTGLPPAVAETMGRRRRANEISAGVSGVRSKAGGIPDDWRDVDSVGSGVKYVGGLALDSLPYMAEAAVGGIAGRAAGLFGGGARGAMAGGAIASYPSAVGDVLGNQREQSGTTDLTSAMAYGVPYAALNGAVGLESLAAKATLPRIGNAALDSMTGLRGRGARALATGVQTAIGEGASETGQEFFNQAGRVAVDADAEMFGQDARKRYLDSFIGGAALGGVVGGALSGGRRSEHYRTVTSPMATPVGNDESAAPATTDILALGFDPSAGNGTYYTFPDGSTALNSEAAFQRRYAPQQGEADPSVPMAFNPTGPALQSDTRGPREDLNTVDIIGSEYPLSLAPAGEAPVQRAGLDFQYDTGNLALAPIPSQDGGSAAAAQPQAPVEVKHSGTPEAIARTEETKARKVAAEDAIGRAQEAGMVSEKQQSLFWRMEELAKEGKLNESVATQVTALLMQSKFGKVKTMLDNASLGVGSDDLEAKYKAIDKAVGEMDKYAGDIEAAKAEIEAAAKDPEMKPGKKAKLTTKLASAEAKYAAAKEHVGTLRNTQDSAKDAIAPTDPTAVREEAKAPVATDTQSAPTTAPAAPTIAPTPASPKPNKLKAAAERANKVRRLESLLACLTR